MRKRLQVVVDEHELEKLRAIAERHGTMVSEWVRQVLRAARLRESSGDPARKLDAIRLATEHSFPTADIEVMLAQTERSYLDATG